MPAPKGNFNALKHGAHSPRVRAALESLVQDPAFRTLLAAVRADQAKRGALRRTVVEAARAAGIDPMAMALSGARRHRDSPSRRLAELASDRALEHPVREELRRAVRRYGPTAANGDPRDRRTRYARTRLDRLAERARNTPGAPVHTSVLDDPRSEWCVEGTEP